MHPDFLLMFKDVPHTFNYVDYQEYCRICEKPISKMQFMLNIGFILVAKFEHPDLPLEQALDRVVIIETPTTGEDTRSCSGCGGGVVR